MCGVCGTVIELAFLEHVGCETVGLVHLLLPLVLFDTLLLQLHEREGQATLEPPAGVRAPRAYEHMCRVVSSVVSRVVCAVVGNSKHTASLLRFSISGSTAEMETSFTLRAFCWLCFTRCMVSSAHRTDNKAAPEPRVSTRGRAGEEAPPPTRGGRGGEEEEGEANSDAIWSGAWRA